MRFTVLIPTHNNGPVIRRAIDSVLHQTEQNFELFVVGDGAPEETLATVRKLGELDQRIRLFSFEKGERHGEAHRHRTLEEASGEIVCYLADDDFWFPDHLKTMGSLLTSADFGNTRCTSISPPWEILALTGDFADQDLRRRMQETLTNFFGLSFSGHRLDAYHRLSEGWTPAPTDVWTDLHMTRKWLAAPGMRLTSSPAITGLNFPAATWHQIPSPQLQAERNIWYELFQDPAMIEALRRNIPADETPLPLHKVIAAANSIRHESRDLAARLRNLFSR